MWIELVVDYLVMVVWLVFLKFCFLLLLDFEEEGFSGEELVVYFVF